MNDLVVRPLAVDDWPTVQNLFGQNGACGGCWCMYWQSGRKQTEWEANKGDRNRSMLMEQIESGTCHAVLASLGSEPVGWCRYGPTTEFPRLLRSRKLVRDDMADWAVLCFFISANARRQGISRLLLKEATREAFRQEANSIEGYPVVPKNREAPAPFAWTGLPTIFEDCGYTALAVDAGARKVYRLHRANVDY
jgi:GNAT superfamily N-acetyltransferase